MTRPSPDPRGRRGTSGFSLVELLTVVAILAVIATLLTSALAGARTRSNQVVCRNNLRQVALAVEIYQDDTLRRPRSVTRLASRPSLLPNPTVLVCPAEPALKTRRPSDEEAGRYWGNRANAAQEPPPTRAVNPEEGNWEAELRETSEKVRFSYLHSLGWRREAWQRLMQGRGSQVGTVACQLHGVRSPSPGHRLFNEFEGQTLRAQRDGAVVGRKIFRTASNVGKFTSTGPVAKVYAEPAAGTLMVQLNDHEYPWEFYADHEPSQR